MKVAVVVYNLGGPDGKDSIRPFLKNFFMDKNIIRAPWPVRVMVSELIAYRRTKREAGESYGLLGGGSPLLENTRAQERALEAHLREQDPRHDWRVFTCMRYWHPMAEQVAAAVKAWGADHIVRLPLYPQFSTTTTRSSFGDWDRACKKLGLDVPTASVCCYPFQGGFIAVSAERVRKSYWDYRGDHADQAPPRVLFSAHGLPESVISDGDPYQWQCEESARLIAEATGIENLDWQICYQSRVGPQKWIGPSTEDALERAAHDKVPVLIYPHAFVSEHVETLVEIEIEYREEAEKLGVPGFARVETVGVAPDFISGLGDMIRTRLSQETTTADGGQRLCPGTYRRCCMQGA